MPDIPAGAGAGAGTGGGAGAGTGTVAPPAPPSITPSHFEPPAKPATEAPAAPPPETGAEDSFEFTFEGDSEKYIHEAAEKTAEADAGYDASKPFDPAIEAVLKDHPDALKALKQGHYELRQWKGNGFKTPAELKAYRERIEKLGGPEKIEAESKEWSDVWNKFSQGDESVLDTWMKDNSTGMIKLSSAYLSRLHKAAPAVWSKEMGKVFMQTLKSPNAKGLSPLAAFNQLYDHVKEPAARALLDQIAETINAVDEASHANVEGQDSKRGTDEERSRLDIERHTVYLQKVNNSAGPIVDSAARQAIKIAFKGLRISQEVQMEILKDVKTAFNNLQKQDKTFQQNANDLLRSQDTERFLRVLKSAIARNMPMAAKREARKYRGLSGDMATRRAEGQSRTESAGGAAATPQRVRYSGPMIQGGPDPSQIDYAGMRSQFGRKGTEEMLGRREFLKKGGDGKTIHFW
jgi:hypothetical protein